MLTINISFIYSVRSDNKYWLFSIPLWVLLLGTFLLWRNINDAKITELDRAYWKSVDENKIKDSTSWRGRETIYKLLEDKKAYVKKYNPDFLTSIFFQTILTFVFQLIGYRKTSFKTRYKWTSIIFGIFLLINLYLELLMSIVQSGPLI
ncbi:MAG: hypothetical protein JSS70_09120 [Bacteroidetes bacterium]|nr:hypothetical protein [Bacteroidota bacterium]